MERFEKSVSAAPHQIILQNRKLVELTGVSDVDSFDDTVAVVTTSLGELTIRGRELHVCQLNVNEGSLSVEGQIDSLSYADVVRGGFLSRLLR